MPRPLALTWAAASKLVSRPSYSPTTPSLLPISRPLHASPVRPQGPHRGQGDQSSLPASYYRGGTSRAVMFDAADLPASRAEWPPIFRAVVGSPDPAHGRQLDGMGGGISSLSKVCVVGRPSSHPGADVDYTFAAVGVRDGSVDFSSNCGNMSAAVGPFAVAEGLVDPVFREEEDGTGTGYAAVRMHNTNTGKIVHCTFPVCGWEVAAGGDFAIDGVAGTGGCIRLDFIDPAGSRTGRLLPTGKVADEFGPGVRATCIDVGNPCVFVQAEELGVEGTISPDEIDAHETLLSRLDAIRRQAGVAMGLAATAEEVPGSVPKIAMVSRPGTAETGNIVVRALSVGQPHRAVPVTVALALAAAAELEGSVVAECVRAGGNVEVGIEISHASGMLNVDARYDESGNLVCASVFRTARLLMRGEVFWKDS